MALAWYESADRARPTTPPGAGTVSSDDEDDEIPTAGRFLLVKMDGEGQVHEFDAEASIGWIVSLVLWTDVFGRGERPRSGVLMYKNRTFKPCHFAEKVWQVVDGTGFDDPPPIFRWAFIGPEG